MKIKKIYKLCLLLVAVAFSSCENQDIDFPDFDYQTVYFASQYYVRTIQLGDDMTTDLTLDNQHKMSIMATMGGTRSNNTNRVIDFKVDESLCDNLYFDQGGKKIIPMPSNYYKLASNQIIIPSGQERGGVEVQLTDAFFEDPKSLENTYAIPLIMTSANDSILQGKPAVSNPDLHIASDWVERPKNYVIRVVKYVNPWHGVYLRRGVDVITQNDGTKSTSVRHKQYVESDEVVEIYTNSLVKNTLPLTIKDDGGNTVTFNLPLTFAEDGTCAINHSSSDFDISGSGKFVSKGEKQSMGGKDRDALYLEYSVNFKNLNLKYDTKDTLVVRDRGVGPEYFDVVKK